MTLGIIAGIGPNSSYYILNHFSNLVLEKSGRLPIFYSMNIDGIEFLECVYSRNSVSKQIAEQMDYLYNSSDKVAALCNTFYASDAFKNYSSHKKTIHLPNLCNARFNSLYKDNRIGIIGTSVTVKARLYNQIRVSSSPLYFSYLPSKLQLEIDDFLKNSEYIFPRPHVKIEFSSLRERILSFFENESCNAILLACTELDELFFNVDNFDIISTRNVFSEILAEYYFINLY
jgi:aspartate/glutamate racemase